MATKLGPWPIGIDNLSSDVDLPDGALRVADDVLIDNNGTINSAPGPLLALDMPGLADLWTSQSGISYGRLGDDLVQVSGSGIQVYGSMGDAPFAFCDHLDGVVAASHSAIFQVGALPAFRPMALPPPAFTAVASASGGLDAGRYGVAVCALRGGEEFGLSPIKFVDVQQGGGISMSIQGSGDMVRVFRTPASGTLLYRATDAPSGMASYLLGAGKLGANPTGQFLEPMPGGQLIASWNGRIVCARGRVLNISRPMRPALYDPLSDYIVLPSRITMVAPLPDGIYLATRNATFFLNGTDPESATLVKLAASPPPEGCFAVVPGSLFTDIQHNRVAVWLSREGFVLGLPEGQIVQPQAKRLRLSRPDHGSLVVHGTRLFALAH